MSWFNSVVRRRRAFVLAVVVCAAVGSSSCGFALAGRGSFLPDYIKIIGIPTFTNTTSYFDIAQVVTDKVRTEFINRGQYQVEPDASAADAELIGRITGITIVPTAFASQQQASRYTITLTASVELRDTRRDIALWSNPSVVVRDEQDATSSIVGDATGPVDPAAFFNQETNAVQRVTDEFARTVVSAILEAF